MLEVLWKGSEEVREWEWLTEQDREEGDGAMEREREAGSIKL